MFNFLTHLITMKRIIFCCIAVVFSVVAVHAQASKKAVNETCSCVKKIKTTLSDEEQANKAIECMVAAMQKHLEELLKEYKINNPDPEQAAREAGAKFGAQLQKDCPDMTPFFEKIAASNEAKISPDTMKLDSKVCANFKSGKFKTIEIYMNKKKVDDPDAATSYTEVIGNTVTDYSKNKKYTTKWTLKWLSGCEWEQTFVESTEPETKTV